MSGHDVLRKMPGRVGVMLLGCVLMLGVSAAAETEPALGTAIVYPVDGALMVYVPAGEFIMGLDRAEADALAVQLGYDNYLKPAMFEAFPRRVLWEAGFFIDQYEVSVERWRRFMSANPDFKLNHDQVTHHFANPLAGVFPAATIRWDEAQQYANWAGKQLPSGAQWEKAARGTDARMFPWGDTFDPGMGHFKRETHGGIDGEKIYTRVGRYPQGASPCGAMDMLGNQYEWTREWFEPYPNNPEREKMLSYTGHQNGLLRGGSWYHGMVSFYAAKRFGFPPSDTHYHVGLRTVWVPPAGYFQSDAFEKAKADVPARRAALQELFDAFDRADAAADHP